MTPFTGNNADFLYVCVYCSKCKAEIGWVFKLKGKEHHGDVRKTILAQFIVDKNGEKCRFVCMLLVLFTRVTSKTVTDALNNN